jgi:hypothetical protein
MFRGDTDTWLLHGIGFMLTLIGAWLVSSWPSMFPDGVILMAYGLGLQYGAVRPLIARFRRDVGPGRHRPRHWM